MNNDRTFVPYGETVVVVMLPILVLLNAIGLPAVSSSLTFLNGSLSGTSYYTAPVTRYLGPQSNYTIEANLVYIAERACSAATTVDKESVQGRAVYLFNWKGCSYERIYDQLAALEAVAVLTMDVYIPGGLAYNMHDGTIQYVHSNMIYVQLGYDYTLLAYLATQQDDVYIRLSPDASQWANMFESWPYEICIRWLPAIVFLYSAIISLYYLHEHIRIAMRKRQIPRRNRFPSLFKLMKLPIIALLIKMLESVLLAFNFSMCGLLATPAWPAPAQRYFIQQMVGCTFVTILIAAKFWNRILFDFQPKSSSLFRRFIIGDFGRMTFLLYLLPIACDTFFSISYATYWDIDEEFYKADAGVHVMAQFVVGGQFLISAIRFRMEAVVMLDQHQDTNMKAYLNRVSVIVIGLGITCLGYVIGNMMIAIYPAFVTPNGWTLTWSIITISHALESLLLVLLFRPRHSPYARGSVAPSS